MAELGETADPRALIPGDPNAIEENGRAAQERGQTLLTAGNGLRRIDAGSWRGAAGQAFQDKFSYEPPKWLKAGDAFITSASALTAYAATLRWAQGQAAEAIRLYQEGELATEQARNAHEAAIAQADAQNRSNAAAGDPTVLTVAPFRDPGEEQRQAARDLLNRTRQQVANPATVRRQPSEPMLRQPRKNPAGPSRRSTRSAMRPTQPAPSSRNSRVASGTAPWEPASSYGV